MSMSSTLRERLIRAEQHFLLAVVSNDEESLEVFSQEWSQLARDIEDTKAAGRLDDSTAHLLNKTSQAIENTAICVLESGVMLQESLTHSMGDFIQDIPSGDPSIASLHSQATPPSCLLFTNQPSSRILGEQMLLDSYAHCWLMQNIHDPYPNSVQTRIISDISGTSAAQVELWFQEVRDSIGWSKLSRDFFAGSANATVAAARRVFLERDKNISFDIVFAFTTVKAFAETLFSEHLPLQGKNVDTESVGTIQTMAMGQEHYMGSSPGEYIIDPDSILVPPQVDLPAPPDPLSDLSDSDESDEEDTTPPPTIAGCKRLLADDEFTSQAADLGRPQKRPRRWPINRTPSSKAECLSPGPPKLGSSSEQTTPCISVPISSFLPSLRTLSPTSQDSSPDPLPSISQKRGYIEDTLESAVGSIHTDISVHRNRKRRLSQCVSSAPFKRQRCPSISSTQHFGTNSTPPSDGCRDRPTDSDVFPQPMLQAPVPGIPVDFDVFDWNSIWDPSAGTASSISRPPVFHVPSSDLASLLLEPPDLGHDAKIISSSSSDLGLLEDLSSLLQFPMPAGPPPDLSTSFAALPHSADSSPLQEFDSAIAEFINLLPPGSTQSSTPLTSSSDPPTPPGNSYLSLPQSQPCSASKQPLFELGSSVPPSAFLPFESGTFTEDVDDMFSLLCRES